MKLFIKKMGLSLLLLTLSSHALAAFTLNGTRYIYNEGKKNISVEVTNNSKETYGGQIWIENVSMPKKDVYMIPTPSFFKVKAGNKQILRIINVNKTLPQDRESIFFINVQEIPPMAKDGGENYVAFAMNTQVKLIYRPSALKNGRESAENKVTYHFENGHLVIHNPTPYYFALTNFKQNGKAVKLSEKERSQLALFKPFSSVTLGKMAPSKTLKFELSSIDDWGGVVLIHPKFAQQA
ncbi:fimbrial chaperone [Photobacterium damselae]|uniref:fimbrial chaperone n=1 Tax=Photobacterium damselae TaxID=38293 RepID=UPI0040679281